MATASIEQQPDLTLRDLEQRILSAGTIKAQDVLALRRAIYRAGGIDRTEAELLFQLNRKRRVNDAAWAEFYVEALTDFFYWREGSDSALSEDAERMLLEWIGPRPGVDDATELRLLLNLMFRTHGCSERFRRFVLDAVRHSVLHGEQALYGHARRQPGVIDAADVEVIRRLVYGMGSEQGMAIGRLEAEFLFELNNATAGARNAPAWRDLFVKAITMYLLFAGGSPERIDEAEARWLIEQIEADGIDHDAERALLAYLKQEATSVHPLLAPLYQRLGA